MHENGNHFSFMITSWVNSFAFWFTEHLLDLYLQIKEVVRLNQDRIKPREDSHQIA